MRPRSVYAPRKQGLRVEKGALTSMAKNHGFFACFFAYCAEKLPSASHSVAQFPWNGNKGDEASAWLEVPSALCSVKRDPACSCDLRAFDGRCSWLIRGLPAGAAASFPSGSRLRGRFSFVDSWAGPRGEPGPAHRVGGGGPWEPCKANCSVCGMPELGTDVWV